MPVREEDLMSPSPPKYIQAMHSAAFYPHPVASLSMCETHISWVFLTGPFVYKVKKPVALGFLDFTSLARRSHYCRQEIILNRRLSQDIYLDVVTVTAQNGGFRMEGEGLAVDYAVRMRQLPSEAALKQRLPARGVDAAAIDRLAGTLARFYETAATGNGIDTMGSADTIAGNCQENFDQTGDAAGRLFERRTWEVVAAATRGFLANRAALLSRRVADGRIRDGHGDLRTDHIYLTSKGIQIIDCIEFNERFRCGDVACDLAFLAMEMDNEGFPHEAAALIDAFVRHSGDLQLYALLDFYKCYRAMVRLKVNCLRLAQENVAEAEGTQCLAATGRYLALAYRYAVRFSRPRLWVVWGQVATGKSTLARALGDVLDIGVLRSDSIRKALFDAGTREGTVAPFEDGIYAPQATALTYGKLLCLAQAEIDRGCSVVLDATFSRRRRRREALRLAEETGAAIVFVECTCSEATIRRRLAARAGTPSVSDARLDHLEDLKTVFEAGDELPEHCRLRVDADQPVADVLRTIFLHLQAPGPCPAGRHPAASGR
jgi:aminoglycoside phosphotransferase family enzyme/predicted kinase